MEIINMNTSWADRGYCCKLMIYYSRLQSWNSRIIILSEAPSLFDNTKFLAETAVERKA